MKFSLGERKLEIRRSGFFWKPRIFRGASVLRALDLGLSHDPWKYVQEDISTFYWLGFQVDCRRPRTSVGLFKEEEAPFWSAFLEYQRENRHRLAMQQWRCEHCKYWCADHGHPRSVVATVDEQDQVVLKDGPCGCGVEG